MSTPWGRRVKGIIFNLLEQAVVSAHGQEAWDALLDAAGVDGAYTSLGSYPDEELSGLVGAASKALEQPPDEILRWFGRVALPMLAERYPDFTTPHTSTKPFLLTLNEVIHPEVRKLYPGADVPEFDFESPEPSALVMSYQSAKQLCRLAQGLIEGAAAHYGEAVAVRHLECAQQGAERCVLRCEFSSPGSRT